MRKSDQSLFEQIEDGLTSGKPLADLLRACVLLGGKSGSTELRAWATHELKGYGPDDEVPEARRVPAAIFVDAFTGNAIVTRQRIGVSGLPDVAQDVIQEEVVLRDGIGQIEAMITSADDGGTVNLSLPGAAELARIMDYESGNRFQHIQALYWSLSVSQLHGVVDQVRTTVTS